MAPTLRSLLGLLLLPLALGAPTPAVKVRSLSPDADIIPGKFIVVFSPSANATAIAAHRISARGLRKRDGDPIVVADEYDLGEFKGYAVEADDEAIAAIAATEEVEYVEPDHWVYASALTTQSSAQWGLGRISRKARGSTSYRYDDSAGLNTYVYVLDTGIYTQHSQFGGRASLGISYISGQTSDGHGHGTHVAGTIAGSTYGVAKLANVIAVKVLANDGRGPNSGTISGLQWVTNTAATKGQTSRSVVNLSLGGPFSSASNSAVRAAWNAGITVVVAAGNEDQDAGNVSPASEPVVITVGATDANDARGIWPGGFASNFGTSVDVFAPGTDIVSAGITSTTSTSTKTGTSMACPHVAGLAAYLIALEGLTTPAAVQSRIKGLAQTGLLTSLKGSPNVLVYNGNGA